MSLLANVHRLLERIALFAVWVGGLALLLAAFMVTIDVLTRKFLNVTMSGADEITGYVFAGATTWAYAYCLLHRSNIRIDALYNFLPQAVRALLDIVGVAMLLLYMGILTLAAVEVFQTSFENDSVSVTTLLTPLWIPQLVWVSGLVFFVICLAFVLAYAIIALFVEGPDAVRPIAGQRTVAEEVKEETHGMQEFERR
ncbi:MAG: TRAP transporter small permease [Pseudomonadota bacterium]